VGNAVAAGVHVRWIGDGRKADPKAEIGGLIPACRIDRD